MPTISINNQQYDLESLPQEARAQLQMLRIADGEIATLRARLAIAQTARNAYAQALVGVLPDAAAAGANA